jgi:hypothetical protein
MDSDGVAKTVSREYQEDPAARAVRTDDGSDSELLAPPVFFSQGELTRIAREPMAQLDLIDRYVSVDWEHAEEQRILRELKANGGQLVKLKEQTASVESDVTDKDVGLEATRKKYKELEKTLNDPVLREYPNVESEGRYLDGADDALKRLDDELDEFVDSLEIEQRVESPDVSYPNRKLLDDVPAVFEGAASDVNDAISKLKSVLRKRRAALDAIRKKWAPQFEAKRKAYESALSKAGADDVKKAQTQLRSLKKRLDELERKSKGQASTVKDIRQLETARASLIDQLSDRRASRFKKRIQKAAQWNLHFDGRIQVNLAEGADHSKYLEALRSLTKGAMLRDGDLAAVAQSFSPTRLRELVEKGSDHDIAKDSGIKPDNARKLVETASLRGGTDF